MNAGRRESEPPRHDRHRLGILVHEHDVASLKEPLPAKKSSRRSPGFEWTRTMRRIRASGFCVG